MRRWLRPLVPALAVTLGVGAIDLAAGSTIVLLPLLVLGPLVAAATTGWRPTAATGALALALAVALSAVSATFPSTEHAVAIVAVLVGSVLSAVVAAALDRERAARLATDRERVRADLLARAGALFEGGEDPLDRLDALAALPIPEMADVCVIDLVAEDGALTRTAVRSRDREDAEAVRRARTLRSAPLDDDHPIARVARSGRPLLLAALREEQIAAWSPASDPDRPARPPGTRSAIVVPLLARGRIVGTLALVRLVGRRPFDEADLAVAQDLARRAGLAVDHARVVTELAQTESELRTTLEALAEAVVVLDRGGALRYANDAALRLVGAATADELPRRPLEALAHRWELCDERGRTVGLDELPARRALAGDAPEPLLCELVDRRAGARRWWRFSASPVLDRDGTARLSVNVIEDVTDQRRRERGQAFLARASKLLSASLDPARTLDEVARAAVPDLADWCAVDMPDEHGVLRRVATADRSPERTRDASLVVQERSGERTLRVGPPEVMRTGRSQFYPTVTDKLLRAAARDADQLERLRAVGARSVLVVPLAAGSEVIGTITLGTAESGRRLTEADLALAEELGRRAGIAVEHARVHGERSRIAATLQSALLPPRLPVIPELTIAARFRPASGVNTVGGDFYDLFPIPGDPSSWMVVVGDVTGKGPAAAAVTALARYTMRTVALYEHDPARVLERLNHVLLHDDDRRRLCTAVCARVRAEAGRTTVTIATAGHPPPLLADEAGAVRPVGTAGTLLGAFEDGSWTETTITLSGREMLVLYTDGVIDTRGPRDRFGAERLEAVLAAAGGRDPDHLAGALDAALLDFQHGPQRDDVAVLVLQPGRAAGETGIHAEGAEGPQTSEDAASSPPAA